MKSPLLQQRFVPAILSFLVAAGFGLAATGGKAQINLDVLTRSGYGVAQIKRPLPNSLIIAATVNGRRINVILDTGFGGEGLTLDSAFARRLGIEAKGNESARSASGREINFSKGTADLVTLGNAQIKGVPINFGIFQGLRDARTRKEVGADGFIGSGFLRACSAVIDLHNKRLYLRPPGTGRRVALGPALTSLGLAEAPFTMPGGNCIVDVEVNDVKGRMFLDTGASLTGVDTRFVSAMKATRYDSYIAFLDAAGIERRAERTPIKSLKIGGTPTRQRELFLTEYGFYKETGGQVIGLLGMDFLGQDWGIIDFGQQKLYFAPQR